MLSTLNTKLFYSINHLASQSYFFDIFFIFLTTTGFYLILTFVFVYILIISPLQKPDPTERLRAWGQAVLITISILISWVMVWYIKVLAMVPRPFEVLPGVHQLVEQSLKTSFPSNHAALSMALATAVYFYHKKLGIILFIIAFLICFSRVYVGVHYPLDVLVGGIVGIVVPLGLISVFKRYRI